MPNPAGILFSYCGEEIAGDTLEKITADEAILLSGYAEHNREVARAQDIRDAYARGELGEEDAIAQLKAVGG